MSPESSLTPPTPNPFWRASRALTKRWWWRLKREPAGLVVSLVQPALWLVLFGNLFADGTVVTSSSYIAFMTGGVVVMTVFNGALGGGVELLFDRETGLLRRLLAAPIPPAAILASRFAFVLATTLTQALLILLVAMLLGVQVAAGLAGVALILVTGALLGVGVTALSMTLAFALKGHAQFFAVTGFVSLPLLFASNALAPLETMPVWLSTVSRFNPMTHAVSSARALILGGLHWPSTLQMTLTLSLFGGAMMALCLWTMRRALD